MGLESLPSQAEIREGAMISRWFIFLDGIGLGIFLGAMNVSQLGAEVTVLIAAGILICNGILAGRYLKSKYERDE